MAQERLCPLDAQSGSIAGRDGKPLAQRSGRHLYAWQQAAVGMTLKAGTIIATGTPKGVAMGMREPQFLKAGDVVVCAIEGIGELSNTVA